MIRHTARFASLLGGLLMASGGAAWAHKPFFNYGKAPDAEHAIPIRDVTLSQVAYTTLTPEAPRLWLTFEAKAGQKLEFQIGVPRIDRFEKLRPTLVVLGPGLPEAKLPFDVPPGLGAAVFETSDVAAPRRFDEPFTGTKSWILRKAEVEAKQAGRHYAVLCAPGAEPAKAWLAIGTREAFGLGDWLRMPVWIARARRFHEAGGAPVWVYVLGGITVVVVACSL